MWIRIIQLHHQNTGKKSDNADCATTYSTARGPWRSQQYFSLADHPQRVLNLPAVPTRLGCSSSSDMHIQICHPAGAKLCTTVPPQPNSYCAGGKVLFLQLAKPFSSADHRKRVSKQPRPMSTLRFFPSSRPWPWKLGFSLLVLCKSLFLPVTMCHPPGKRPTDLDTGRCLDAMPYPYRRRVYKPLRPLSKIVAGCSEKTMLFPSPEALEFFHWIFCMCKCTLHFAAVQRYAAVTCVEKYPSDGSQDHQYHRNSPKGQDTHAPLNEKLPLSCIDSPCRCQFIRFYSLFPSSLVAYHFSFSWFTWTRCGCGTMFFSISTLYSNQFIHSPLACIKGTPTCGHPAFQDFVSKFSFYAYKHLHKLAVFPNHRHGYSPKP